MNTTKLSSSEIQDLIARYNSELKKLQFQISDVKSTISELKENYSLVLKKEKEKLASATKTTAKTPGRKRGRPAKKVKASQKSSDKAKGYKLSEWDEAVIKGLRDAGKSLLTGEIVEQVAKSDLSSDIDEVKKKVVRSLQKLANRREDIKKVKFKGKGFSYALPEWLSEKGRLLKEFKR